MIDQCAAAIAILEKDNENLAKLDEALLAFAEDTQLFSTKIDYAKAHFNDYHLICGMLQEANNCDIDAFRKVSDIISTDIQEDLCGDIIHDTKQNADEQYQYNKQEQSYYEHRAYSIWTALLSPALVACYYAKAAHHKKQALYWEQVSDECQRKMDLFDQTEIKTMGTHAGDSATLRAEANNALVYMAGVFVDGKFNVNTEAEWRPDISGMDVYNITPWIADEPFNLEANKGSKLYNALKKIGITQEKIDAIWRGCEAIYDEYGIQMDPLMLLCILAQEGNGSFNTSADNPAADGQHGYEPNFAKDLIKANNFVFGKIIGYMVYGEAFNQAVADNTNYAGIDGTGNFAQYANWITPVINLRNNSIEAYEYAGHGLWHKGVTSFYESVYGEEAMNQYSNYLLNIDEEKLHKLIGEIDLKEYTFNPDQNAQTPGGDDNGEYTIISK